MKQWCHLYYADADYGNAMADSFIAQVDYIARTDPSAALYRQRTGEGGAHYYFSPAACQTAQRFFATPCSEPLPSQRGERIAGRVDVTSD